jgi:hypothetical protein
VRKECKRCGSSFVEDHDNPIDCLTWRKCETCFEFYALEPDQSTSTRDRIIKGLTQTVTSRFKRWGMR